MNDLLSDKQEISFGVPQESVLLIILFLIYVSDLSEYISNCMIIQYADDTQSVHKGGIDTIENMIHEGEKDTQKG